MDLGQGAIETFVGKSVRSFDQPAFAGARRGAVDVRRR